ncbi:ngep-related [Anaeramoeba flamelloides]|uniref:Ngep-related n=1 Tax=Anaeramoeba flamelloides TaxID=1746091 RepID=A0ABQ8YJI5_9EUKA|nr:ngep-related [Anaeramoeba flamelloides]
MTNNSIVLDEVIEVSPILEDQTIQLDLEGEDILFEYVMVLPEPKYDLDPEIEEKIDNRRQHLFKKLIDGGLYYKLETSPTDCKSFLFIGTTIERMEEWAVEHKHKVKIASGVENNEESGYETFRRDIKNICVESTIPGCVFNSCTRQKIILEIIQSHSKFGGSQISILQLLRNKTIINFFGLHNYDELKPVIQLHNKSFYFKGPTTKIRDYFGENIAFYFGFLKIYTYFLVILSIIGIIITISQHYQKEDSGQIGLWYIIIVSLWITFFIEYWKRKSSDLTYHWDMLEFHQEEKIRTDFKGVLKKSLISNKKERYYPESKRKAKYVVTYSFTIFMMIVAAGLSVWITNERLLRSQEEFKEYIVEKYNRDNAPFLYTLWTGVLLGILIFILSFIFNKIGKSLTEWENHKYSSKYENSLILKYFMFQSVNNYVAIFCSAFIVKDLVYVANQLMSILITKQIFGNIMEVGIPWIKKVIRIKLQDRKKKNIDEEFQTNIFKQAEKEEKYHPYENTISDYLEMFIQLGFSTFFVLAFPWGPLAPLLALINNLVEIRTDGIKLLSMQRPIAKGANGIGRWAEILKFMSIIVIVSNIIMMTFAYDHFTIGNTVVKSPYHKLYWLLVIEHLILLLKFIVHQIIPDVPKHVQIEILRREYQLLHPNDSEEEESSEEDVIYY